MHFDAAPHPSTLQYQSAPFFRRLAARLLDLIFCLGLTFIVVWPIAVLFIPLVLFSDESTRDGLAVVAAALSYFVAYVGLEVFLLVRRDGQTLGKGLCGLRVVRASASTPTRIPLGAAIVRMLLIFLPFALASVAGNLPDSGALDGLAFLALLSLVTSLIMAAVPPSGERRALHDFAAGTRVVRAAKRKIDIKQDFKMALPGKIDMTKRV